MRYRTILFAGAALFTLMGCGSGSSTGTTSSTPPPVTPAVHNEWTWVGGPKIANQAGVYGTMGVPAAANIPAARWGAVSWTDASNDLWLFGGLGLGAPSVGTASYNDLWKYSGGQWTWEGGSTNPNTPGIYGTQGVAAPGNLPGGRYVATSWKDAAGNFWLFGGFAFDANGLSGFLNDLWKYSGGQWTWMGGSKTRATGYTGVYGSKGTAASGNFPGGRYGAVSWTDTSGNLWLFGGNGYDSAGTMGELNDLWEYSGGQWTWVSGSNLVGQSGTYVSYGAITPGASPGARDSASGWVDSSGNFWLFGGISSNNTSAQRFNDLWEYMAGQWIWKNGSSSFNLVGTFGTQGVAAAGNTPGTRSSAAAWSDASGGMWLFSGNGVGLSDLWKASAGQWAWEAGPMSGVLPVYGTQGTAAAGNLPGFRGAAVTWRDGSGNLWMFGGEGPDSAGTLGNLSDVWEYTP